MKIFVLSSCSRTNKQHGIGLIVDNTLREWELDKNIEIEYCAFDFFRKESRNGVKGCSRIQASINKCLRGFLKIGSAFGIDFSKEDDCLLSKLQLKMDAADVVFWFGSSWDPVSSLIFKYTKRPVILHVNDSIYLFEKLQVSWLKKVVRMPLAYLREKHILRQPYASIVYVGQYDYRQAIDLAQPHCVDKIKVICNGVDVEFFRPGNAVRYDQESKPLKLLFTGVLNYQPNVETVSFVCEKVLPFVKEEFVYRLVGKSPSGKLSKFAKEDVRVQLIGQVDDIVEEYQKADVLLAPLAMSCGVKNKILEAIACELPVFTLEENYKAFPRAISGVFWAKDARGFIELIEDYVRRPNYFKDKAKEGRKELCLFYSWKGRTEALLSLVN